MANGVQDGGECGGHGAMLASEASRAKLAISTPRDARARSQTQGPPRAMGLQTSIDLHQWGGGTVVWA